jgi:hypothetical protein
MSALTELEKELDAVRSWIDEAAADVKAKLALREKAISEHRNALQVLADRQAQAHRYAEAIGLISEPVPDDVPEDVLDDLIESL